MDNKFSVHFENEDGTCSAREFTYNVHTRRRVQQVREILTGEGADEDKAVRAFPIVTKGEVPDLEAADVHDITRAVIFFLSWTSTTTTN